MARDVHVVARALLLHFFPYCLCDEDEILPGLVRYDEAMRGPVRHAYRMTVRRSNGYVWPASHRAGSNAGALPLGARLRLKSSKSLSSYPQ